MLSVVIEKTILKWLYCIATEILGAKSEVFSEHAYRSIGLMALKGCKVNNDYSTRSVTEKLEWSEIYLIASINTLWCKNGINAVSDTDVIYC